MFSKSSRLLVVVVVALVGTVTAVEASARGKGQARAASAELRDAQGNVVGKVKLLPRGEGRVTVLAEASLLPAGFHGFHVHAIGRCEAPFTTAGGHANPGAAGHGAHAGDMPVLFVDEHGRARAEFDTNTFDVTDLVDADGSAIIVHAAPDNYANIPARYAAGGPDATTLATGDAGARIACGVVE